MRTGGAYRGVLAIHDARALIGASAASQLGDWLFNAALLGYVYSATGSAGWVGAATICRLLPYVLLGPVGGMIADRYDRRTVLLVGDLLRCALMLALAAVVATEGPVELVIALTALASAAGTAERPAAMAMLPRMVGESRLAPANALLHTVQDLGVVVGPAIGAILLAVAPDAVAFLVNGATFAASAALISTMRRRAAPVGVRRIESMRSELMHGLHTARTTPFVVPLFVVVAMAELTYGAQTVQLVLYASSRLDVGAAGYGYLLAVAGLGGLLSATVNARLAASTKVAGIVVVAGAVFCATQLAYAWTTELAIALLVTLLGGAGFVACEVVAETALARVVRSEVLGRVMGVFDALSVAAMVLGAVLAPVLIARTSLRTSFVVLGIATVVVTFGCLAGLRRLGELSRKRADVARLAAGGHRAAPDHGRSAANRARTARLGVTALPAPAGSRRRRRARACPRLLCGGRRKRARPSERRGGRPHRPGWLVRGARPARQRSQECDRHHRGAEHDPAHRGRRAARRAPVCPHGAVGDRSLQQSAVDWGTGGRTAHRCGGRPGVGTDVSVGGATVVVISAGYEGKRRAHVRMAELGARLVIVDEPGHWSESLVSEGVAAAWLAAPVVGDADQDAQAVLDALAVAGVRPRRRAHVLGGQRLRGCPGRRRTGTAGQPAGGG